MITTMTITPMIPMPLPLFISISRSVTARAVEPSHRERFALTRVVPRRDGALAIPVSRPAFDM